jgi:hypothetical protein
MYDIFYSGNNVNIPTAKKVLNFQQAQTQALTKMFWFVPADVEVSADFNFDHTVDEWDTAYVNRFLNKETYDGIVLAPKNLSVTQEKIATREYESTKDLEIIASTPKPFDQFYIDSYDKYLHALETSSTELFWVLTQNVTHNQDFIDNFYFSHDNTYDRKENHAFVHDVNGRQLYNGVFLCSKHKPVSKREIEYRFLVSSKEWPDVVSTPVQYEIFTVDTYDDYLHAVDNSSKEMFWAVRSEVDTSDFLFDLYFSHDNKYDREINHSFLHKEEDKLLRNSVWLLSKKSTVSQKEIEYRFLVGAKEWDIVASKTKQYDRFVVNNYNDYELALENTSTDMFWAIPNRIQIIDESIFDLVYPVQNNFDDTYKFERNINHVFKNGDYYDGLILCSKNCKITQKEFDFGFIVQKQEVDRIVSKPKKYQQIYVDNYDDYVLQLTTVTSNFVWVIPNDVEADFLFDYQIPTWEKENIHIFKNGKYNDGIFLQHVNKYISKREFEFCWHNPKKEIDIIASNPKPYDIVFISYQEPDADDNYANLLERFPRAKRVHGVKGIHQAHIAAAKLCDTDMIWIVDGDAIIVDDFNFDYQVPKWQHDHVFVWRSKNPVNDMVYGYGGVKLFPRQQTLDVDVNTADMTTSISTKFNAVQQIANITSFNTDPFNTWKSAFRECAKLASKTIRGQVDEETEKRLDVWCTRGDQARFGRYAIRGACAGRDFGYDNRNKPDNLRLINDFDWLKELFDGNT